MLSPGLKTERTIECSDTIDVHQGTVHAVTDDAARLFGKISVVPLDVLKDGNQATPVFVVFLNNADDILRIDLWLCHDVVLVRENSFLFHSTGTPDNARFPPRVLGRHNVAGSHNRRTVPRIALILSSLQDQRINAIRGTVRR